MYTEQLILKGQYCTNKNKNGVGIPILNTDCNMWFQGVAKVEYEALILLKIYIKYNCIENIKNRLHTTTTIIPKKKIF